MECNWDRASSVDQSERFRAPSGGRLFVFRSLRNETLTEMDVVNGKRPLAGNSFYFDLVGCIDRNSLATQIQQLGGVVDAFLSRDVKYIVTSRSISKPKEEPRQVPILNSISPASVSPMCSLSTILQSPWSASPRNNEEAAKKSTTTSRSEQLVVKALTRDIYGTTDVIQNALNWGVKLIHVDALRKFLAKKRKLTGDEATKDKPKQHATGTKIMCPLLKFESCDRKYKPHYKHFDYWPVVKVDDRVTTSPFELHEIQINPQRQVSAPIKPKSSTATKKKACAVWKTTGYCEICTVSYKDLFQHLQTDEHLKFCGDESNYRAVDELISRYPLD